MKDKYKAKSKIQDLFKAKELYHKELAKLPFEEKIEIVVRLQEIVNDMTYHTGKNKRKVWRI